MHPTETKNKFIELRAQGLSLSRIADQLTVSKRTLVDWNREHQADIDSLRALEIEALHEKLLASHEQELTRLAALQRKIDDELANRPLETLSTDKLLRMSLLVRREIRALCESSQIKVNQAKPISAPSVAQPILDPELQFRSAGFQPADHCSQSEQRHGGINLVAGSANQSQCFQPGDRAHSPEAPSSEDQSTQIKVNQAETISSTAEASDPQPSTLNPQLSQEHCLHCGDPLPPLLPDGTRPSPWCACGSPIAAAPGFSIRELCPACAAPVPVHGYNVKRWSGKCSECHTVLPNLDPNAPLKWLPPNSELQSLASVLSL